MNEVIEIQESADDLWSMIILQVASQFEGLGYRVQIRDTKKRSWYGDPDLRIDAPEPMCSAFHLKLSVSAGLPRPWPLEMEASSRPGGAQPYAPRRSKVTYKGTADKYDAFVSLVVGKINTRLKDLMEKEQAANRKYESEESRIADRKVWTLESLKNQGLVREDLERLGIHVRGAEGIMQFRYRHGYVEIPADSPDLLTLVRIAKELAQLSDRWQDKARGVL